MHLTPGSRVRRNEIIRLLAPNQLASLRTTHLAKPARCSFRPPVPVELLRTCLANSLPPAFRHIGLATPHRFSTNLSAFSFPHCIMAVTVTYQSMSNFVKNCIQDFCVIVAFHKMNRKLNPPVLIYTQTHRPLTPIECKRPEVQAMRCQLFQGKSANIAILKSVNWRSR